MEKKKERWYPGTRVERSEEKSGGSLEKVRFEETDPHMNGRPLRTIWKDPSGKEIERCTFEYDPQGRLVGEVWKDETGERRLTHTYGADGSRTSSWDRTEN